MDGFELSNKAVRKTALAMRSHVVHEGLRPNETRKGDSWPAIFGGLTTSALPARTTAAGEVLPGQGTATLYRIIPAIPSPPTPAKAIPIGPVTVHHYGGTLIESGKWGVVVQEPFGNYVWIPIGATSEEGGGGGGGAAEALITFTLNAAQSGSTEAATVVTQYGDVATVGATVNVQLLADYKAPIGAKGVAVRAGTDWVVVEIEGPGLRAFATLGMGPSSFTRMTRADTIWAVENVVACWPFPNVKLPAGLDEARNPFCLTGFYGDRVLLCYDKATQDWFIEAVNPRLPQWFTFAITSNMPATYNPATYGVPYSMVSGDVGDITPIPANVALRDLSRLCVLGLAGDTGLAKLVGDQYVVIGFVRRAQRIRGVIVSDYDDTDSTFAITTLIGLDGMPPATTNATIANIHGWTGTAGGICRAEWNQSVGQWEAYQQDCPEPTPGGGGGGELPPGGM